MLKKILALGTTAALAAMTTIPASAWFGGFGRFGFGFPFGFGFGFPFGLGFGGLGLGFRSAFSSSLAFSSSFLGGFGLGGFGGWW